MISMRRSADFPPPTLKQTQAKPPYRRIARPSGLMAASGTVRLFINIDGQQVESNIFVQGKLTYPISGRGVVDIALTSIFSQAVISLPLSRPTNWMVMKSST